MSRAVEEERALVERMLSGDEAAMEAFADVYLPRLYRFAGRILRGDGELTRDIVQATAVKVLGKLEGWRGDAPLFTWLCACCKNEIAMHLRSRQRKPTVELDEAVIDSISAVRATQDQALARKETVHQVHAMLDALPPHYARALEWKYVEQLSVGDIAARLGLGLKAAESVLSRARKAFREGYADLETVQGLAV